jgi:hypothetical protein
MPFGLGKLSALTDVNGLGDAPPDIVLAKSSRWGAAVAAGATAGEPAVGLDAVTSLAVAGPVALAAVDD